MFPVQMSQGMKNRLGPLARRFCFWLKDHSLSDYMAGTSDFAKWSRELLCMTKFEDNQSMLRISLMLDVMKLIMGFEYL